MCLDIKRGQKPKIAKKDIVVWKHIIHYPEPDRYKTSYQYADVRFNELFISEIEIDKIYNKIDIALHSYKNKKDAQISADYWHESLVKCIIPKDSVYYKGKFDSISSRAVSSYASNQLIYQEIVK